jgi:hypothetical protein
VSDDPLAAPALLQFADLSVQVAAPIEVGAAATARAA